MDRLRRRLEKLAGENTPPVENVESSAKGGGHGDHWGCVVRAYEQQELLSFIGKVISTVDMPEMFGGVGVGMAARSSDEFLRACVLVVDDRLVSAYPEVADGPEWPVTVTGIVPWENGIEGQITGTCYGAEISFFDTRFYSNKRKYLLGETYNFRMGGLAYTLGRAPDTEVEIELGASISFRGAHAFMPASVSNSDADIDDFWFHSPLEGTVTRTELAGRNIDIYPVILALPNDFPMSINLFAASHVLGDDMRAISVGDDLEGFLWLQGYLSERTAG